MKNKPIAIVTLSSILLFSLLTCLAIVGADSGNTNEEGEITCIIADSTGDWGYPSPHGHYPRGPGYVRMSLVFDTLVWKCVVPNVLTLYTPPHFQNFLTIKPPFV
ncbi:MAG: hypothetical protein C5S38_01550 [Candidatus Methanophagaceae archaeon]|nr:MAG: hypothetical protein C5S38_01550 [Methanophagales archaeon]